MTTPENVISQTPVVVVPSLVQSIPGGELVTRRWVLGPIELEIPTVTVTDGSVGSVGCVEHAEVEEAVMAREARRRSRRAFMCAGRASDAPAQARFVLASSHAFSAVS